MTSPRPPEAGESFRRIEETVRATHGPPGPLYWLALAIAGGVAGFGAWSYSLIVRSGLHWTGLERPGMWGNLITDFVFWVGIAHSGTLISAILFLFRARFRTAVYRLAEMMTVFAVMTAGLFPILHLGRPWFAYWLLPYPNQRQLWVNFRSPLVWDVFAISTYLIVSTVFLLVGVAPDAAALRDRASGWRRRLYAAPRLRLARHRRAVAPLHPRLPLLRRVRDAARRLGPQRRVLGLRGVSLTPGWHSTLFPPYFVAGAILSGVAMVITILIPVRRAFRLEDAHHPAPPRHARAPRHPDRAHRHLLVRDGDRPRRSRRRAATRSGARSSTG